GEGDEERGEELALRRREPDPMDARAAGGPLRWEGERSPLRLRTKKSPRLRPWAQGVGILLESGLQDHPVQPLRVPRVPAPGAPSRSGGWGSRCPCHVRFSPVSDGPGKNISSGCMRAFGGREAPPHSCALPEKGKRAGRAAGGSRRRAPAGARPAGEALFLGYRSDLDLVASVRLLGELDVVGRIGDLSGDDLVP